MDSSKLNTPRIQQAILILKAQRENLQVRRRVFPAVLYYTKKLHKLRQKMHFARGAIALSRKSLQRALASFLAERFIFSKLRKLSITTNVVPLRLHRQASLLRAFFSHLRVKRIKKQQKLLARKKKFAAKKTTQKFAKLGLFRNAVTFRGLRPKFRKARARLFLNRRVRHYLAWKRRRRSRYKMRRKKVKGFAINYLALQRTVTFFQKRRVFDGNKFGLYRRARAFCRVNKIKGFLKFVWLNAQNRGRYTQRRALNFYIKCRHLKQYLRFYRTYKSSLQIYYANLASARSLKKLLSVTRRRLFRAGVAAVLLRPPLHSKLFALYQQRQRFKLRNFVRNYRLPYLRFIWRRRRQPRHYITPHDPLESLSSTHRLKPRSRFFYTLPVLHRIFKKPVKRIFRRCVRYAVLRSKRHQNATQDKLILRSSTKIRRYRNWCNKMMLRWGRSILKKKLAFFEQKNLLQQKSCKFQCRVRASIKKQNSFLCWESPRCKNIFPLIKKLSQVNRRLILHKRYARGERRYFFPFRLARRIYRTFVRKKKRWYVRQRFRRLAWRKRQYLAHKIRSFRQRSVLKNGKSRQTKLQLCTIFNLTLSRNKKNLEQIFRRLPVTTAWKQSDNQPRAWTKLLARASSRYRQKRYIWGRALQKPRKSLPFYGRLKWVGTHSPIYVLKRRKYESQLHLGRKKLRFKALSLSKYNRQIRTLVRKQRYFYPDMGSKVKYVVDRRARWCLTPVNQKNADNFSIWRTTCGVQPNTLRDHGLYLSGREKQVVSVKCYWV